MLASTYYRRVAFLSLLLAGAGSTPLCAQQAIASHQLPGKIQYLGVVGLEGPWAQLLMTASADLLQQKVQKAHFLVNQQKFWENDQYAQAAVAVQMIAQSDPYVRALVRVRGKDLRVWHEPIFDVSQGAPDLDPDWLVLIKDKTAMPEFRGRVPDERGRHESAVYNIYCQAVRFANDVPLEAFVKSAEDNDTVTFGHLFRSKNEASPYRGKVIPIRGKLLRLRRYDAPVPLKNQGIRYVYEAWIEGPTKGANPFCVTFPLQPEDKTNPKGLLEPAETMSRDVTFYGYFIKLLPYPAQIGKTPDITEIRHTPMLIGPTLILDDGPPPAVSNPLSIGQFPIVLFIVVMSFGGIGVFVLVGLNWWFRRGDRQFHDRLRQLHTDQALAMLESGSLEAEASEMPPNDRKPLVMPMDDMEERDPADNKRF